jgi:hypothetical protein
MAESMQSLDQLSQLKTGAAEAPRYVKKVDKHGRAYATGKRKDAVARVWIKPGSGKITVNTRTVEVYFARPVLRMMIQRPGRRGAPRPVEGADQLRARAARRPEEGRLPHARLACGRAQEVRPRKSPPFVPVLEALAYLVRCNLIEYGKDTSKVSFFFCVSF